VLSDYGRQFTDMLTAVAFPVTALVSTSHLCNLTDSGVQSFRVGAVMQQQLLYTFWLVLRSDFCALSAEGEVMSFE
jgi:hypothetical protein